MNGVEFTPPANDLYRNAPLDFAAEFPVLGIPVRFESNSEAVIRAAEESFGVWRCIADRPELIAAVSARVRLFVQDGNEGTDGHASLRYRWPDPDRMLVSTPGSFGVAEVNRYEAYAFVTTSLVADTAHFQYGILEAMALVLVTGADRHPIHAATVSREGAAVLLCGASSSGTRLRRCGPTASSRSPLPPGWTVRPSVPWRSGWVCACSHRGRTVPPLNG